jgi:hypothetical protein
MSADTIYTKNEDLVRELWKCFHESRFDDAKKLFLFMNFQRDGFGKPWNTGATLTKRRYGGLNGLKSFRLPG